MARATADREEDSLELAAGGDRVQVAADSDFDARLGGAPAVLAGVPCVHGRHLLGYGCAASDASSMAS